MAAAVVALDTATRVYEECGVKLKDAGTDSTKLSALQSECPNTDGALTNIPSNTALTEA